MFKKNLIYCLFIVLLADVAFAAGKGNPPRKYGFLSAMVAGTRALLGSMRARVEPGEEAQESLHHMRDTVNSMMSMTLGEAQTTLPELERQYADYLNFIEYYGVTPDADGAQQAREFLEQARALIRNLERHQASTAPDHEGSAYDGGGYESPTGARHSGNLATVVDTVSDPLSRRYLDELLEELRRVNEATALELAAAIQALTERLGAAEHQAEDVMTTRGAVQEILRSIRPGRFQGRTSVESSVANDGALFDLGSERDHVEAVPSVESSVSNDEFLFDLEPAPKASETQNKKKKRRK